MLLLVLVDVVRVGETMVLLLTAEGVVPLGGDASFF